MTRILRNAEEKSNFAEGELGKICASWNQPCWDELDWTRIKELQIRDILEHRKLKGVELQQAHSLGCPAFVKHVGVMISKTVELKCELTLNNVSFLCVMMNGSLGRIYCT